MTCNLSQALSSNNLALLLNQWLCGAHGAQAEGVPVSCRDAPTKLAQHDNGEQPIQSVIQLAHGSALPPAKCLVMCLGSCAYHHIAAVGMVHSAFGQQPAEETRPNNVYVPFSLSSLPGKGRLVSPGLLWEVKPSWCCMHAMQGRCHPIGQPGRSWKRLIYHTIG